MVFVEDKTLEVELKFPKNNYDFPESYTISLKSQATNQTYEFEAVDIGELRDYYIFKLDLSEVRDGEYEYKIGSDKGVMQIGNRQSAYTGYTDNRTYIEYNS